MNKTTRTISLELAIRLQLPVDTMQTLARAEKTLHRWAELECGDGNDRASWSIERDEATGKPSLVTHLRSGGIMSRFIPDREAGALKRVRTVCKAHGLHFYHQTDPRGCALYVSKEPLTDSNYNQGVAACLFY